MANAVTNAVVYDDGKSVDSLPSAGTTGQFLMSQGSGTPPVMANLSGAITGITDGSNAGAGIIGEIITSSISQGSAVSLTTTAIANITSITLTAGDWDVHANAMFGGGAITGVQFQGFIGTVTGNDATGRDLAKNTCYAMPPLAGSDSGCTLPVYRVNISTTTTYYLKANATFTIGSAIAYGTIEARRIR